MARKLKRKLLLKLARHGRARHLGRHRRNMPRSPLGKKLLLSLASHEKKEAKTMHKLGLHKMAKREKANAKGLLRLARRR